MVKKLLNRLPHLNLKVSKIAILIYSVSAIIIIYFGLQKNIRPGTLTIDVQALVNVPFYYGAISTIGVLMWCASSTLCFFGSMILYKINNFPKSNFLLLAGIISLFLMVDDQFLLHEYVVPGYLGIDEVFVLGLYPLLIGFYFIRYYKDILTSQFLVLVSGLSLLALSIFIDMFLTVPAFLEDGFKFIGIAGWFAYQMHTSYSLVMKGIDEKIISKLMESSEKNTLRCDEVLGNN